MVPTPSKMCFKLESNSLCFNHSCCPFCSLKTEHQQVNIHLASINGILDTI